jgi:hypothetical protein
MSEPWKMPDWMKPYESFLDGLGGMPLEALMTAYKGPAATALANADQRLRSILANTQVGLLVSLRGAGLLPPLALRPALECPVCHKAEAHPIWDWDGKRTYFGCRACGTVSETSALALIPHIALHPGDMMIVGPREGEKPGGQ